jgi:1-acyl-sn-glycerol-3-phosphate acyltransferase
MAALPLPQLRRAYPAAAADYFFSSPARSAFARLALNALPFARDRNIRQSLRMCHAVLDAGAILIIFPEGTRSTGGIKPFKPGIGQIVAGRNVPVVPCHIDGAADAWPKTRWFPRPCKLRVTIGQPTNFAHMNSEREAYHQIARRLEDAVRALAR